MTDFNSKIEELNRSFSKEKASGKGLFSEETLKGRPMTTGQIEIAKAEGNPRPFDFSEPNEIKRWFVEMRDFLRHCNGMNFIECGTDFGGREYALDGFIELANILTNNDLVIKAKIEQLNSDRKEAIEEVKELDKDKLGMACPIETKAVIDYLKQKWNIEEEEL